MRKKECVCRREQERVVIMKKYLFPVVFILFLLVCTASANEGIVHWGTPAWDKKIASFEISPREAEKYLFCRIHSEVDSIEKYQPIRAPVTLWFIDREEYFFSWASAVLYPKKWGLMGIGVNGHTGEVRFIHKPEVRSIRKPTDQDSEICIGGFFPYPPEAFAFVRFSKKEVYQLLKEVFPEASKEELKKCALEEWKCLEENGKFIKETLKAMKEIKNGARSAGQFEDHVPAIGEVFRPTAYP